MAALVLGMFLWKHNALGVLQPRLYKCYQMCLLKVMEKVPYDTTATC
ncbi:hypothetical protein SAMN05421784_10235 [Xenorhabdus koppenhoeferi]|uniref:Uncharacterized protein n=1 Tax=Xenorhabdus koppenhoeferi TaxID=351659 RepID=A0A1I7EWH5_9GAMM|nr:hypothetical protein SAMN05421784_10235 [Xenorhabdus koppenhoeferi]